jgi:hypothetical protein
MFEDDLEDDGTEYDSSCQNCTFFHQDSDDWDYGICTNNEIFEPYIDEIFESDNFSCCRELYLQNRVEGVRDACEQFEEIECMDIPEGVDIIDYLRYENLKSQNVNEVVEYLYNTNVNVVKRGLNALSTYVYNGNLDAFEILLKYYLSLGPAESLEDVYLRKDVIDILSRYESDRRVIEAYVNELERTPSNNITRQLYTLLLERLYRCYNDIVFDLLFDLLNRKKYSQKIKNRIIEVMESDYSLRLGNPFH